jgi:RNase adaptor protein for sRNA GlmZ degradation
MSKNTINKFVRDIVVIYSKYDSHSKCHYLNIDNVPDFLLDELSSLIMKQDNDYACEATSMDNPAYEKSMLPSLIKFMSNSTDNNERIDFINAWQEGVRNYFSKHMQQLINDQLDIYNAQKKAS